MPKNKRGGKRRPPSLRELVQEQEDTAREVREGNIGKVIDTLSPYSETGAAIAGTAADIFLPEGGPAGAMPGPVGGAAVKKAANKILGKPSKSATRAVDEALPERLPSQVIENFEKMPADAREKLIDQLAEQAKKNKNHHQQTFIDQLRKKHTAIVRPQRKAIEKVERAEARKKLEGPTELHYKDGVPKEIKKKK